MADVATTTEHQSLGCVQVGCNEPATHAVFWPGRDTMPMCDEHKRLAEGVAAAIGMQLKTSVIVTVRYLHCGTCGKQVSTGYYAHPGAAPDGDMVIRATIECPECIAERQSDLEEGIE